MREERGIVSQTRSMLYYRNRGKRLLDLGLVLLALPLVAPIMAIVAVLVRAKLGVPVLFHQERSGFGGTTFTIHKFRTMMDARDAKGKMLPDADRLSPFGCFLRSSSLDELPELINVLRGEMSLVGPRPLLVRYLERYTSHQARRHQVRPGITGWAQVSGRNTLSWNEKFTRDIWYVDHLSLSLDLKILALTIWKAVKREGINQPGQATAQEFMGTSQVATRGQEEE